MIENFTEKLQSFAARVQREQHARLVRDNSSCEANMKNAETQVIVGPKYSKVNVGNSGRYMVVNETGQIFGTKGYGVIDKKHPYGTLDTAGSFDWSGYVAKPVKGVDMTGIDFHPLYGGRRRKRKSAIAQGQQETAHDVPSFSTFSLKAGLPGVRSFNSGLV